jgi:hypothetical protein
MSAGLPGFGLGGLLFVACALLAPIGEVTRSLRGTSTAETRRQTLRQFSIALTMVGVFELTRRAIGAAIGAEVDLRAIAITGIVLVAVLVAAKAAELAFALRRWFRNRRLGREPGRYSPASRLASDPEA